MADERIHAIQGRLEAARAHTMAAARLLDEIGRMDLHASAMLILDLCTETSESLDRTEDLARVRMEAEDIDLARNRREERHLRVLDEESAREEARKVGRETL